ncbi:Mrp/NBP35 family ATP-binding protein [Pannonibacter indicus]|jgi:ATP-binding protein involved in chromosome partitioning|uniref:Iron-sulfur cluster carrier protein n=1 Tax=Pannonibacter indicus TaxID=466044 RepID=A0A0K6HUJ2_9HYPH|nr:Mrp/NBP35 family ATP-binding protein [Pannonibacter indicus]CUA94453.1 Chromosome partitioning ATPase, Mrp family, contains Fe-S cluster [Pannonibacter indicus]
MSEQIKAAVHQALSRIPGPDGTSDIVSLGLVSDVFVSDGRVAFSITVPAEKARQLEPLRQAAETAVKALPGVEKAMVALTAERISGSTSASAPAPQPHSHAHSHAHGHPHAQPAAQPRAPQPQGAGPAKAGVPGVAHIIAVASGKGGVGKSTTTANLALAMKANGLKVGVLDADIYGPSVPRLFGVSGRPEPVSGRIIKPLEGHGLKVMSIGFMVEEDTPMIWRGPMVMSALTQMLREVAWGELDVLVVDMPPGTGDAQLTMAQQVPLSGAVIVSTPQDLALIDARKGLNMFRRVDVPVLGIIENMSYFVAPDTGKRYDIFGHGGARAEAERLHLPFLGEVPLDMDIRINSDAGTPVVVADPQGAHAAVYRDIAAKVWASVTGETGEVRRAPPRIVID